eukprot:2878768-Prymnesium_polylepis.1
MCIYGIYGRLRCPRGLGACVRPARLEGSVSHRAHQSAEARRRGPLRKVALTPKVKRKVKRSKEGMWPLRE